LGAAALFLLLLLAAAAVFQFAYLRSRRQGLALGGIRHLHSLPTHYALYAALWCVLPSVCLLVVWMAFQDQLIAYLLLREFSELVSSTVERQLFLNTVRNLAVDFSDAQPAYQPAVDRFIELQNLFQQLRNLAVLTLAVAGAAWGVTRIRPRYGARQATEKALQIFFLVSACVAVFCTLGIVLSVLFEALRFFSMVPVTEFLFGTHWSPQLAVRADQVGSSGAFGAVPLITGTLLIAAVAMFVAVPVGLMSAIYLAEYANRRVRSVAKPTLEILAGIPTVVYGFFAALTLAPLVRDAGTALGLSVSSESALAAGLVMGVMTIPFVSSLSDDVIKAVPQSLREGAYGLGATPSEMVRQVVLPAALPGLVGSVLLAVSRAIGETMIVVMAAGLAARLTANPLESVTTITVQIVTLLVGDQEFDSPKTLAAFALGLLLFFITLGLNVIALVVVRRYRERYE